jgi:hypothetical protein
MPITSPQRVISTIKKKEGVPYSAHLAFRSSTKGSVVPHTPNWAKPNNLVRMEREPERTKPSPLTNTHPPPRSVCPMAAAWSSLRAPLGSGAGRSQGRAGSAADEVPPSDSMLLLLQSCYGFTHVCALGKVESGAG